VTPEDLVGALLRGAVGGRGKRSRGATRFLTGGRGSLINAGTLLTAAGLAWGAYEAATRKDETAATPASAPPPPLPISGLPPDVLRLVRLAIAAARADGRLTDEERASIVAQARSVGAEAIVEREIQSPRALVEIVAGVSDSNTREQLYVLAFTVVRADEGVSGGERIFLAQLAHALGLDPVTTARLETEAARDIDATAGQEA
jgi:uncharacterized membrane protein YebE (DUF533 family)